jgi:hypothetical protein
MRESPKHGPRLDDELARETRSLEQGAPIEARVEEGREKEGPGDLERDVDARTAPPGALGADDVEARRELSRHLRGSAFPAERERLLVEAESQNAPAPVLSALRSLPAGEEYANVAEVWAALDGADDPSAEARVDPLSDAER